MQWKKFPWKYQFLLWNRSCVLDILYIIYYSRFWTFSCDNGFSYFWLMPLILNVCKCTSSLYVLSVSFVTGGRQWILFQFLTVLFVVNPLIVIMCYCLLGYSIQCQEICVLVSSSWSVFDPVYFIWWIH